jgi:hypothetical protein
VGPAGEIARRKLYEDAALLREYRPRRLRLIARRRINRAGSGILRKNVTASAV